MSKLIGLVTVLFLTSCGSDSGSNPIVTGSGVVYGEGLKADNRAHSTINKVLDRNNISYREARMLVDFSKSTAGMVVLGEHVNERPDGSLVAKKLLEKFKKSRLLCDGERFGEEYTLPICTGFLVGPDLMVTAGHCVNKINFYKRAWVFGYDHTKAYDALPSFSKSYVYHTKEVLEWEQDKEVRRDYALIRLDRRVTVARPLKVRKYGAANNGTPLAIIGHPSGLPTKISAGAEILDASEDNAYKTNLDSFGGNSGSPVFNLDSGEIEGILISGATDYVPDVEASCYNVNTMKDDEGAEYVAKISLVNLHRHLRSNNNFSRNSWR